jgi:hypothetical protein
MTLARLMQSALAFLVLFIPLVWAANEEAIEARMRADLAYLASDELEGRGIETKGIDLAADYIARKFVEAGLVPGGSDGWHQPFLVHGAAKLDAPGKVTLHGPLGQTIALKPGVDFEVMGLSGASTVNAPLVFAGHGAVAKDIDYDDYKDVDVTGKIAVVLRHTPRWNSKELPFDGPRAAEHAELPKKQALAESRKAAAVIVVNDVTEVAGGDKLMTFDYLKSAAASSIPAIHLRRAVLDMIFQSSLGAGLKEVERAIDRDLKPRGAPLAGWTATIETAVSRTTTSVKNVVGVLDGTGPLAKETIVIGAHYDHLGYGGRGSRAKDPKKKEIHNGADDNASGTAALIELARRFGAAKERQGRRLVFIAFSAEETGLLGSQHYCNKEPLFPLETTAAMVNLDMVGRLRPDQKTGRDRLIVEGVGTAKGFEELVDKLNDNPGFTYVKRKGGTGPSDHDSFYRKKVPVLFFWTDSHEHYHRPTDDTETINFAGMRKITDLAEKSVAHLAADPKRPEYVHIASTMKMGAGKGPRLGIMPNYDEAKPGLLVGGVSDDGPAAKGGVKAGDLIVEIAGRPVTNIETYMVIMGDQAAGRPLDIVILRGKDKVKLKVTP